MAEFTQTFELAEPEHDNPEFRTLMASIGYLMFYWTLLDQAVLDGIKHLRTFGRNERRLIKGARQFQ